MKLFRVRCGQDREDAVLMRHGATASERFPKGTGHGGEHLGQLPLTATSSHLLAAVSSRYTVRLARFPFVDEVIQ